MIYLDPIVATLFLEKIKEQTYFHQFCVFVIILSLLFWE